MRILGKKGVASMPDPGELALAKEKRRGYLDVSARFAAVSADGSDMPDRKDIQYT
jgi:hypothetical protein